MGRLCWEPHKLQVGAESSSTLIPQPTRPWSEDFEGAIEDLSLILPPRAEHVGRRGPDGSCCPPIRPPLDTPSQPSAWIHLLASPAPTAVRERGYRALERGYTRKRCAHRDIERFPDEIQDFANQFVQTQRERRRADCSPAGRCYSNWVLQKIAEAGSETQSIQPSVIKTKYFARVVGRSRIRNLFSY